MPLGASIPSLVAAHGKWLMAFLRGLLGADEAEDAFQDVWLRVISAGSARGGDGMRAYLAHTARSVAIDRFRRRRPTESLDAENADGDSMLDDLVDPSPSPVARFESKATAQDVRLAIMALPPIQRQVVLMRVEAELDFNEIAAELGLPRNTVLSHMHRATIELTRRLGGLR